MEGWGKFGDLLVILENRSRQNWKEPKEDESLPEKRLPETPIRFQDRYGCPWQVRMRAVRMNLSDLRQKNLKRSLKKKIARVKPKHKSQCFND